MSKDRQTTEIISVDGLSQRRETAFTLEPDATERARLASALGLSALRKMRFEGQIAPQGRKGWALRARLGATVVQPCIVSLEPVTTRIDTDVIRRFVPADQLEREEAEAEMAEEDDVLEPLGASIDLAALAAEALALNIPAYPRKEGIALEEAQFAPEGVAPLKDEDTKPFAGLAALKDKLQGGDGEA